MIDRLAYEVDFVASRSMPKLILQTQSLAFEKFLKQEGLAYSLPSSLSRAYANGARIFLLNQRLDESYLRFEDPCFFITQHNHLGELLSIESTRIDDTMMFSMPRNDMFSARSFYIDFPVYSLKAPTHGSHSSLSHSSIAGSGIHVTRVRNHWIASLPWNLTEWKHEMTYRPYYSHSSEKHFYEIGPRVDWAAFRRTLKEILLLVCTKLKCSLYAKQHFAKGKKFFSVRIDADGFSQKSTDACLEIANQKGLTFDWFIDVGSWSGNYSQLKKLSDHGQSIGLHDFYHMTYRKYRNNLWNMQKGSNLLTKACGRAPTGIVSPFGYYFNSYQQAIKDLKFSFSSEFGYDTDNLPSHPHNNVQYPLQIPVHPGSIGTLQKAGFTDSEIIEHLYETALRQCSLDGFVVLYDHPIGRLEHYSQAYSSMIEDLVNKGLNLATMTEISTFWNSASHMHPFKADEEGSYQDKFILPDPHKHAQQMASFSIYRQVNDSFCLFILRSHLNSVRSYFRSK
jgi:peptidoglycan/xylan/chitin deacetylase (PgdA/CDA1 family)